jgi:hypothetical protein
MSERGPVVLAGVAHLRSNWERDPKAGREPLELLAEASRAAARAAARDAGVRGVLGQLDGVSVVQQLTWSYDDLAGQPSPLGQRHRRRETAERHQTRVVEAHRMPRTGMRKLHPADAFLRRRCEP